MTNQEWALAIVSTIVVLLGYAWLWNKNKPIAIVLLILAFAYFGYHGVDWAYWDTYFKVDWGSGGLTPVK